MTQTPPEWTSSPSASVGDILVVDDRPPNLVAIEAALADLADRVVKANSGREALRHLLVADVALILLDVQMPGMNGLETARLIRSRERSREVPIIFITAFDTDDQAVLEAYKLGAVDFLFKPIRREILYAKASVFVALRRQTVEIGRQANLLCEHERRAHERELAEQKHVWETEVLREEMERERLNAEQASRHAEELSRTIAERERAELALSESNQRLAAADRRKDEFLAILGHELRNPLAPLVSGLEILCSLQLPDKAVRVRDAMRRQLGQLCRLVDDLLDVSRISAGKIELRQTPLDLADLVRQAVDGCRDLVDKLDQRIELDVPDEMLEVHGDAARLIQITSNLLNNASRYSGDGARIGLSLRREGDEVVLRVTDDGCGIPPDAIDRIFDLFIQVEPGQGLGVGLSLVHRLVELHGGTLRAESPGAGKGSVFTVSLPLHGAGAAAGERDEEDRAYDDCEPHALHAPASPLRIVLIDDNDDVRDTLGQLIEMAGHSVHAAEDGPEGLELLFEVEPDVALVDISLPRLDGYDIARRVRQTLPNGEPRLVAMTGYGTDADRTRAEEAGFNAHLVKPATLDALLQALLGK